MNSVDLLDVLAEFTREATKDLILPTKPEKKAESESRAAAVYKMNLPDPEGARTKAPYIIHQVIDIKDVQQPNQQDKAYCTIRTVFCVYHPDAEVGGLALLNLMERLRIDILRKCVLAHRYRLDKSAGVQGGPYDSESTRPFYLAEMISVWEMPSIKQEVSYD